MARRGYQGTDSFSYTVSDGKASTAATISLSVQPGPNDADDDCDDRTASITVQASARITVGNTAGLTGAGTARVDWSGSALPLLSPVKSRDDDWLSELLGDKSRKVQSLAEKTGLVVKTKK